MLRTLSETTVCLIASRSNILDHTHVELWLHERWVKLAPVFNANLCRIFGVPALEFDGVHDAVWQQFDTSSTAALQEVRKRGTSKDFPFDACIATLRENHPKLFDPAHRTRSCERAAASGNGCGSREVTIMSTYALDNGWQLAQRRLSALQQHVEPISRRRLARLGSMRGWHCLEVGAGLGATADWLSEQVGPSGKVLATDIDIRFLRERTRPNLEIRQHDVTRDALPSAAFDLVHVRWLLYHLRDAREVVAKLLDTLRPGGSMLRDAGATQITVEAELDIVRGGSALAEFWRLTTQQMQPQLLEHAAVDEPTVREALDQLGTEDFWTYSSAHVAALGRKRPRSQP